MSDNMTGGMQDISSMSMGSSVSVQGGGRKEKQKKPAVKLGNARVLIAAGAAVVLLIVVSIVVIVGASERKKVIAVMDDFFEYTETAMQDASNLDDIALDFYEEHYPKEIYKALEDAFEDAYDTYYLEDWYDIGDIDIDFAGEIVSITQIKDSESMDLIQDGVEYFSEQAGARLKAKDIDISRAYLVLSRLEMDGESFFGVHLVVKVNGKYGVYGSQVLEVSM